MVVNPFWFGVLVTISIEMAILIVYAGITFRKEDDDDDKTS
jgi:hypothetical protein